MRMNTLSLCRFSDDVKPWRFGLLGLNLARLLLRFSVSAVACLLVWAGFGFQIVREKWEERSDGTVLLTLLEIKLFEVSPCTIPAYEDTEISARSQKRIEEFKQRKVPAHVDDDAELDLRLALAVRKFPRAALDRL